MKHLKTYEDNNYREDLNDLKKLLYHIKNVIDSLGYLSITNFIDTQYNIYFSKFPNTEKKIFEIQGEFSKSLTFLSITLRIGMNDFSLFIQQYFKTINGLELYNENPNFFNIQYKITGGVDDIINQISKDDIKLKMDTNKYNL